MKKQTYEEAVTRLEEIVSLLETGNLSLEDSMKLFEEGSKLTILCSKSLDRAEQKVTQLSQLEKEEDERE